MRGAAALSNRRLDVDAAYAEHTHGVLTQRHRLRQVDLEILGRQP